MNYKFDGISLYEGSSFIGKMDRNDVKDGHNNCVGKIDGFSLKDRSGTVVAKLDGDAVKNKNNDKLTTLSDIKRIISGAPGRMEAVALWYFFIR